ncbi:lysylphosphatidylglycerol synthase transmembrane domain-containing protein [Sphingobacterium rhinopitheci]|uniref:lysylphosphatidylglycerol synthase transmembrane domain-containing protein n=1 Tax=Sphingobacterium rhinopitheci TaxID=2781960 RepID=UPI001F52437F|nr:lysylphosphatidylglycerol synthase transmembrane domain-containing protein [Sphingobacterium rhinopitheci]MCI0920336.1 flippase-like domain-containing protein [Sphingobacterium rhinopitheci]
MSKLNFLNIAKNAFKVIVTLAALYWLSRNLHFEEFKQSIINANFWYLFLALLSYITSQVVASSRLNSFFKTIHLKLSESYNLKLYWLGLLYNFFLPGGVGGDAYKVYFLKKKYGFKTRQLLSAVFFDRLSGLWALAIFSCAFIVFMPRFAIPNEITILLAFVGTAAYLYILYLFFRPFAKRFIQTHVKALGVQGFQILTAILILLALNHNDKFSPHLLIFLISSITAIIPSVGGALGVRDSAAIALGKYLQVDFQLAATISLIFYFISLITSLPGLYFTLKPSGLGEDKLPSAKEVEKEIIDDKINENE